ncbi:MAG: ATP-binding cassette domain-containing protein [Roseibium album]|jgi:simple sugar transport system ATP-binding protein|uniref:Galactose/methyl galactoside import ATP-binding protein MglA n=1 Tax=Roseibium album TaxID=311410 RepID=A0A0M6Z557_9HYPH|nr:ATP-binding cassette domain-containing protein [Roseibium album]MBG6165280.1 simple sugar transport system ATP-binding protein [Labrenzia sp. EL_195]MBG6177488.1 simple sugar transport system ATP-binding protein [Labrenzia sp. EL_132]MBG6204211.1 simple sugar transport system ATP-binding protein [Labrenzia sp. EL_13]MBG6232110.1 simple sugar transport system ATP-binding protein [Labrenzia sp. EL_208]CTQ57829.1 Galactose/methyl galactoside import ATP-binding protein MglA [Roseibium album]
MSLLELSGVEKSFGPVQVLHGVNLSVAAGEVVGLVGDNGAGKSTLMKTITGVYTTDSGRITFDDQDVTGRDPGERRERGIEMIYQDLALAPQQDVANNIFLGREPTKRFLGILPRFVDKAKIDAQAQEMIDRLGVHVPSIQIPVGMLSGGQQQTIAIARALTFKPKLVIMDEPTAALAVREVESVLNLIRQMQEEGIATILISHRLNDVFEACGRIVVLRRGNVIADLKRDETDMAEVVSYIVGAHG